jgi:Transposase DDE domain
LVKSSIDSSQHLDNWEDLLSFIPLDLDSLAYSTKAVQRKRYAGIGAALLRTAFAYSLVDMSLRSVSAWQAGSGISEVSDVAILKRLRRSPDFLEAIFCRLLENTIAVPAADRHPSIPYRIRLMDGTCVRSSKGQELLWRLHVTYDLFRGCIDRCLITDKHGGEHLQRSAPVAGDLIVADRGYAQARHIHALSLTGAHVLLRIGHQAVRLIDQEGKSVDPLGVGQVLGEPGALRAMTARNVWLLGPDASRTQARLIVIRKPMEAAQKEKRRMRLEARRKGRKVSPRTIDAASYTMLLTTITDRTVDDQTLADLYRARWQIEMLFKRLKSVMNLDLLRARDPALTKAYLLGKMIAAIVQESISAQCRAFSPWEKLLTKSRQYVEGDHLGHDDHGMGNHENGCIGEHWPKISKGTGEIL